MTTTRKILSISTQRKTVVGTVEIDGEKFDVHALDLGTHQALEAAEGSADGVKAIRDAVTRVVPGLPAEKLAALTTDHAQQLLTLAGAGIEAVENAFPNAVRPETPISPA